MAKCSNDNPHDGRSLAKRFEDGTTAGIEAATTTTFLQVFKGQDPHYPFKMLLVGEAGSGKTSFLNLLYNCATVQALGCGFGKEGLEYFRQFNDIQLENAQSTSMESKTNDATLYNVEIGEVKVGIIDTPGFGDSRGLKQDEINIKRIIEVLKKEEYINCVCLIINGRQACASASFMYSLTEITAILPREILQNLIVVFSNASDPLDLNLDPSELTAYFGRPVSQDLIFFIENPYCKVEKAKAKVAQLGIERFVNSLERSLNDTVRSLNEIFLKIKNFQQVHAHHFITLYEKKHVIEGNIFQIALQYCQAQIELDKAIKKAKEKIDAALNSKTLNKEFRFSRWVVEETNYHNTLCGYASCYSNCHVRCSELAKSLDKELFKSCYCMQGTNTCTVCGHYYIYHYHEHCLFKQRDFINEEMRSKFEKAKNDQERAEMLYAELENQKQSCKKEILWLSNELLDKIKEFEELGVARNYVKLIETQLAVIETRLESTVGSEREDLQKTQEALKKKLDLIKGAQSATLD